MNKGVRGNKVYYPLSYFVVVNDYCMKKHENLSFIMYLFNPQLAPSSRVSQLQYLFDFVSVTCFDHIGVKSFFIEINSSYCEISCD